MAKIHAYIISSLKDSMPKFCGKGEPNSSSLLNRIKIPVLTCVLYRRSLTFNPFILLILPGRKKKELMKDLPTLFKKIQEEHLVSPSDIPSVTAMQEKLAVHDFSKFPNLKPKLIEVSDLR